MSWSIPRNTELQACRMRLMIDRLRIDKGALARAEGGELVGNAFRRCLNCMTLDECLPFLSEGSDPEDTPAFCPNAATFVALKDGSTA